jgi:serine/threonine protein kinase
MPPSSAVKPSTRAALIVERYAVYDEFAAGGMATVHFARLLGAQGFRRTVAAKRLLPHLTRDQDFSMMLVDEARLAARVRHPNVVSTLDVVQAEGELLLVMDYVHGESLAKLSSAAARLGERVPLPIAVAIVIDALHGLHAAHEATDDRGQPLGLVHRDMSPQNVLVGLDGITRIADFGVAKARGRANTTRDGVIKGKLAYMAPEQLNAGAVSRATDVFAASVVLWELCAGERLFVGHTPAETVFNVMSAPIPPVGSRSAVLSSELEAIVMRGLSRDVAARFATAREMALALEASAPSVRPSEIATWVERIAGASLSQRASVLRAVEHGGEDPTDAATNPVLPRSAAWVEQGPSELETGKRLREPQQRDDEPRTPTQPGPSGQLPTLTAARSGLRRRLGVVAALVLLALLVFVSTQLELASTTRRAPLTRERGAPAEQIVPAVPASAALGSPAPHESAAVAVSAPWVLPQPAVSQGVDAGAASDAPVPAGNDKRRPRATRRSNKSCDPPYTTDEAGRVLFKVECM